ncbi:MAG: oxidoreductase, partial [Pseudomonadota bacterium]
MLFNALPLLAPLILLAAAFAPRLMEGVSAQKGALMAEQATLGAIVVALLSAISLAVNGSGDSFLIGLFGIGLSARLDIVSVVMLLLVTFIGWVVVRYARTYLDGEDRQDAFTFWLLTTLSAVLLLI